MKNVIAIDIKLDLFSSRRMCSVANPGAQLISSMKQLMVFVFVFSLSYTNAQDPVTLSQALHQVLEKHPAIKTAEAEQQQQRYARRAAVDIPKTDVSLMYGQYNSAVKEDNNVSISQTIPFPTLWSSQRNLAGANERAAEWRKEAVKHELAFQVKLLFQQLLYDIERAKILQQQDSILTELVSAADMRYLTGESALIEKMSVEVQHNEIQNQLQQNQANISTLLMQLQLLMQVQNQPVIAGVFEALPAGDTTTEPGVEKNPLTRLWKSETDAARLGKKVEINKALPEFSVGYFNQTLIGTQNISGSERFFGKDDRFHGFTVGVSLPLWLITHNGRVKTAQANEVAAGYREKSNRLELQTELIQTRRNVEANRQNLVYYQQKALPNAILLENQSITSFKKGAIDHTALLLNLQQALMIKQNHLQAILQFNKSVLMLSYLKGHEL